MIISSTSGHACEDTQHKYPYMHDGHLLRLKFSQNVYELRTMTDGHGTLQATHTSGLPGDTVTLTPVPDPKYTFTGYQSTGCTINGNTLTFGAQDCTAKANFYKQPEKILVSSLSGYTTVANAGTYDDLSVWRDSAPSVMPLRYTSAWNFNLTTAAPVNIRIGLGYGSYKGDLATTIGNNPDVYIYDSSVEHVSTKNDRYTIQPNTFSLKPGSAAIDITGAEGGTVTCPYIRYSAYYACDYTATCGGKTVTGWLSNRGTYSLDFTSALGLTDLTGRPYIDMQIQARANTTLQISAGQWRGNLYRME